MRVRVHLGRTRVGGVGRRHPGARGAGDSPRSARGGVRAEIAEEENAIERIRKRRRKKRRRERRRRRHVRVRAVRPRRAQGRGLVRGVSVQKRSQGPPQLRGVPGGDGGDREPTRRMFRAAASAILPARLPVAPFGSAYISKLAPDTLITPHCGPCNARLRCSLGLDVPRRTRANTSPRKRFDGLVRWLFSPGKALSRRADGDENLDENLAPAKAVIGRRSRSRQVFDSIVSLCMFVFRLGTFPVCVAFRVLAFVAARRERSRALSFASRTRRSAARAFRASSWARTRVLSRPRAS